VYGSKEAVKPISAEGQAGQEPVKEDVYGSKASVIAPAEDVAENRRQSIYGAQVPARSLSHQSSSSSLHPVVKEESEYGSKRASAANALSAMSGKPALSAVADDTNEYAYAPLKAASAQPAASSPPVQAPMTEEQMAAIVGAMPAPQKQQAYSMLKAAVSKGQILTTQQQQLFNFLEASQPPSSVNQTSAAASVPQVLSPDQIAAMVNAMTPQQQQQAHMVLVAAVNKGQTLSPPQQQLLAYLEPLLAGSHNSVPAAQFGDNSEQGKKGLFFNLPKKQKFQFGIPGREIITLRHFDRMPDKKKKQPTEKVLMVICSDIAFVCKQATPGDNTYELFDKPVQRDKVTAEDPSPTELFFQLKLGKEAHFLVASSKEEKMYWIQTVNARANFVPTDKLPEKAAAAAAAATATGPA